MDGRVNNSDIPVGMAGNGTSGAAITLKSAAFSIALAVCFGMLIWVKLRLVTNMPRVAYAEPEKAQVEPATPNSSHTPAAANTHAAGNAGNGAHAPKQQTATVADEH